MRHTRPLVVSIIAFLVLSAFASVPVTAQTVTVSVETKPATEVSCERATLNGNLTELEGADNATVFFEYWVEGDPANASQTDWQMLSEPGPFNDTVSGLEENTTYVFQAQAVANDVHDTGSELNFTTDECGASTGDDAISIGVQQAAGEVTVSVTENGSVVENATVSVSADGWDVNDSVTDENGFVIYDAPNETVNATITATTENKSGSTTVTIEGSDGEGPDVTPPGQMVSSLVSSLLTDDSTEDPLGQLLQAVGFVGDPPDHAGPPAGDDESSGPPGHAGPPDDDDESSGPPDHAGPPADDDDSTDEDESAEDDESSDEDESDDDDDSSGPPEHAGPPA